VDDSGADTLIIVAGTPLGASAAPVLVTSGEVAALLALFLSARTDGPAATSGAFDRLSRGDQKIARALFEAQSARGPGRLGRDQIAAPRGSGEAWGEVFRMMKAQGLVADKNLGQAGSRFNEVHRAPARRANGTKAR
jgi:hypothetical protein